MTYKIFKVQVFSINFLSIFAPESVNLDGGLAVRLCPSFLCLVISHSIRITFPNLVANVPTAYNDV